MEVSDRLHSPSRIHADPPETDVVTYGRKKRLMRPNLPSLYGTPSRKSKQADPLSYDWKSEILVSAHAEDRNKAGNTT